MKKLSLSNMQSALSKSEMKKIMAGSEGIFGCGFCQPTSSATLWDCVTGCNSFGCGCICPGLDAPGANVCHH